MSNRVPNVSFIWIIAIVLLLSHELMNQFFITFSAPSTLAEQIIIRIGDALIGIVLVLAIASVSAAIVSLVPYKSRRFRAKFRYAVPFFTCLVAGFLCAFSVYRLYKLTASGEYVSVARLPGRETQIPPSANSDYQTVHQYSIQPYRQVDSLVKLLDAGFREEILLQLDSICQRSDGDLSESFYELGGNLLNEHLADYLRYLAIRPTSCLKAHTILGLSADIAVYDRYERDDALRDQKDSMLALARGEKLPANLVKVLENIYAQVKPAVYD